MGLLHGGVDVVGRHTDKDSRIGAGQWPQQAYYLPGQVLGPPRMGRQARQSPAGKMLPRRLWAKTIYNQAIAFQSMQTFGQRTRGVEMKYSVAGRGIGRLIVLIGLLFGAAGTGLAQSDSGAPAAGPAFTGVLTIIWGDSRDGTATVAFYLNMADGRRRELSLASTAVDDDLWRLNGHPVTVYTTGDQAREASPVVPLLVARIVANGRATENDRLAGELPYLSLLCAFPNGDGSFESPTFYREMYGNDAPQLGHYWDDLSYGAVSLAGSDVAGPFAMPHPFAAYGIPEAEDLQRLGADCIAAADPTVDFSAFHGVNLMFNVTSAVWAVAWGGAWSGVIEGAQRSIAASWLPTWAWSDISVVAHEMGHTFGLPHSSGPYGYTYDNPYDVMSDDRYPCYAHNQHDDIYGCVGQQTIGYHKRMLGWLAAGDIATAGAGDQTIKLDLLAAGDNGPPRLIVVPVIDNPSLVYTIEARQTTGYDSGVPGAGVVIHRVDHLSAFHAILMDGDGNGHTTDDGVYWEVGEVFAVADDGITITVAAATPTGYEVDVHVAAPPPFTNCAAQAERLSAAECAALVALYNQTNGPQWTDRAGWLTLPNPCHWHGVDCARRSEPDGPAYAVTGLALRKNGLEGPIPTELADLPALFILDLSNNRLVGPLPPELSRLTQLTELLLGGHNRLTGGIPPEWGRLSNLTSLVLSTDDENGGLSGPIPEELRSLDNLVTFVVSQQDLSGPIPAFLGEMTTIMSLGFDGNRFEGLLPASLGNLAELRALNVRDNPLSGGIPHAYMAINSLIYLETEGTGLCLPPDAAFQAWIGTVIANHDDIFCDTSLAVSYGDGAPGSRFALRGVAFPPNVPVTVAINGVGIGQVQTDEFGEASFLLDTEEADEGRYDVSVRAEDNAVFTIRLYDDRPLRPGEEGPALAIPSGTAAYELFAPAVYGP